MKSNIFIPKTINVGYQNRSGTYTGKLAYVIYYDEKGQLRKEVSWNNWRDKKIPNEEFENIPISGFVLNKKVGDYASGWNHRQAYCRIYDPRNFEFEITIENLLYILENANSIKGKGLEGEFIYGWDGKDLVLMPVESPDYKQISEYNSIVYKNNVIKAKDLKIGATYLGKDNVSYIYMGKFDKYDYGYWKNNIFFSTRDKMEKYCRENNLPRSKISYRREYDEDKYAPGLIGKQHCFCYKTNNWNKKEITTFMWKSSLNKFLISVIDENCSSQYADYFNLLEGTEKYSPIDHAKDTWHEMTIDEFKNNTSDYYGIKFFTNIEGKITKFEARPRRNKETIKKYTLYAYSRDNLYNGDVEILDLFPNQEVEEYAYGIRVKKQHMTPVTIEEIFYRLHPLYKQTYLANGREYKKEYKA